VARAKHTGRAEARRKYRQATSQVDLADVDGAEAIADDTAARPASATRTPAGTPRSSRDAQPVRPGFTSAFRAAYHRADLREDLRLLPRLVRHWSFFAPIAMIVVGTVVASLFWNYTGGQLAWQVLVYPGSGFGLPQLVAGFFAPRASYLLGFLVSIVQGIAATFFVFQLSARTGTPLPGDQISTLLTQAFIMGPVTGTLFAAAAAWYRRFLALSGPRRAQAGGRNQARSTGRGTPSRRPAGR
jgi:hypothetical protein